MLRHTVGVIGKIEPVVFTIGSDDDDESDEEYDDVFTPMTLASFCDTLASSGRSINYTMNAIQDYYIKLIEKRDTLKEDIHEKEEQLKELKKKNRHLENISHQIGSIVRFAQTKLFWLSRTISKRRDIIKKKLLNQMLMEDMEKHFRKKNEMMRAEIQQLKERLCRILRQQYSQLF